SVVGNGDAITSSAAQAAKAAGEPERDSKMSVEEKALLNRVLAGGDSANGPSNTQAKVQVDSVKAAPAAPKAAEHQSLGRADPQEGPKLAGGKPLPSPFRAIAMLGLVLAGFGGFALLLKRFKGGSLQSHKGFSRFSSSVLGKIGSAAKKEKLIEVVA